MQKDRRKFGTLARGYKVEGYIPQIHVISKSGIGDVNIHTTDGKHLYIESKKGEEGNKSNSEYPLMREAIGQLMTGQQFTDDLIPIVAVPYTKRSYELACKWSQYKQIRSIGIRFILVFKDGNLNFI